MNLIEQLESKLKETLEVTTPDDRQQWFINPVTKGLLIQLEIDKRVIQDNWAEGLYPNEKEEKKALGGVQAITEVMDAIKGVAEYD